MKTKIIPFTLAAFAVIAIVWFAFSSESKSYAKLHTVVPMPDSTINWDSMDFDAKKGYMKAVVMPHMKALFVVFDSAKYSEIKCKTCHGEGVASGTYKMPNPRLPKLPKTAEGFKALMDKHPDMMKFMGGTVKPEMAKLLGLKQYNKDNPTGFGCGNCHTQEE
ncbi:MAG TPA: hypothetical protein VEW28_01620 [Candidatus Kapabacteria bacterium]|nr:hypothetical protein [Candidatus Kapabacteria bacterium]